MLIRHLILLFVGLVSGIAVSDGTFAFIIALGVIPRLVGKSATARHVMLYETAVILGGVAGNLASVYLDVLLPGGRPLLLIYGLCAGIFEGCIAVTLAEILHVFPIMFRRLHLKTGLFYVISAFALGKTAGAIYYFLMGMQD